MEQTCSTESVSSSPGPSSSIADLCYGPVRECVCECVCVCVCVCA